jgi:dienelactone hydrolase
MRKTFWNPAMTLLSLKRLALNWSVACCLLPLHVVAEPIQHEVQYPHSPGPFPAVLVLHTSGGFHTVKPQITKYVHAGYAVYAPDFFKRHGITRANRFETWTTYRQAIEQELQELIALARKDPEVDANNIFAVGFSNGGYWATYLAAKGLVNAAASHYGVWSWPPSAGFDGYPANYLDEKSNPVLAIHGDQDSVQRPRFVLPQLARAAAKSPKFKPVIFPSIGHSWDCDKCKQDGFDQTASDEALRLTLDLFQANRR